MTNRALLCLPKAFTVLASNSAATAPAVRLGNDEPGLVWRSSNLTAVHVTLQLDGSPVDTLALVGTNLRSADTVRVRMGASQAAVEGASAPVDMTVAAWSGTSPVGKALTLIRLNTPVSHAFLRIDITSTGNPAGYVEATRLVVGKRVENEGVDIGAEMEYTDGSPVEDLPGYTTVDPYPVRLSWKVTLSHVKEDAYYANWHPFLAATGKAKAFLFVPDADSTHLQAQAIFGRVTAQAKSIVTASDYNRVELTVLSTS